jgi:hypothetical protein
MIYTGFATIDSTHVNDIQHIHLIFFMFLVFGHNLISYFLKFAPELYVYYQIKCGNDINSVVLPNYKRFKALLKVMHPAGTPGH